jgi:AraC-like DNA-binding protein
VQDTEERMVLAKRYLDQQSLDAPLNIQHIAKETGCSVRHLTRMFIKEFQTTPQQYWMQRKLQIALDELRNTEDSLEQIANKLGWSRVWLHQQVKKQTGKSPSEIREDQQTR